MNAPPGKTFQSSPGNIITLSSTGALTSGDSECCFWSVWGVKSGYLDKQRDFWAPAETRFQKPLWAAWYDHWSLPSTLHHPSHRRPLSRIECHPEEQKREEMRHTGKTHTSHRDERTYVQCVCGEADLRHLHVERALVVAQSALMGRERACQLSVPPGFLTHLLPSFLSHPGSDVDVITETKRTTGGRQAFPFL